MNWQFVQETPASLEVLQVRKTPRTDDQIHGPIMIPIDGQKPSDFGILRWQRWQNMLVTECCEWGMEKSSKHFLQYLGSTDSRLMPVVSRNFNKFTSFQQKWPDWGHRSPFKWANELQPGHCPNSSHRKGCQGRPSKPTHRSVARSTRCGHHGAHSTFRSTELTNTGTSRMVMHFSYEVIILM